MRCSVIAAVFLMGGSAAALAQGAAMQAPPGNQQDMMKMMHLAARNQLGVLEYCQAQGFVDADTVGLQKKMLGMLPPAQVDGLDDAEATGKTGVVLFAGNKIALADAAKTQNTTPDALCKQMANMLKSQAAQMPQMKP